MTMRMRKSLFCLSECNTYSFTSYTHTPLYCTHPLLCVVHTHSFASYTPTPLRCTHPLLYVVHTHSFTSYTPTPLHCTHPLLYIARVHTHTQVLGADPLIISSTHCHVSNIPSLVRQIVAPPGRLPCSSHPNRRDLR